MPSKGLPIPDEAAIRERVLRKNVATPDLITVKDFVRFHAAASKGKIKEKITLIDLTRLQSNSSPASAVSDTQTDIGDRSEVYDVSTPTAYGILISRSEKS